MNDLPLAVYRWLFAHHLRVFRTLLFSLFFSNYSWAVESNRLPLEVQGKVTPTLNLVPIKTQFEVRGKIADEHGEPISSTLHLTSEGKEYPASKCAPSESSKAAGSLSQKGDVCFQLPSLSVVESLVLQITAPHYKEWSGNLSELIQSHPGELQFQALDAEWNAGAQADHELNVTIIGQFSPDTLVSLFADCTGEQGLISQQVAQRNMRFRLQLQPPLQLGRCKLVIDAPDLRKSAVDIFLYSEIKLTAELRESEAKYSTAMVRLLPTSHLLPPRTINEKYSQGLIEAWLDNERVALAPVYEQRSEITLPPANSWQEITLRYIPGPSFFRGATEIKLTAQVQSRQEFANTINLVIALCLSIGLVFFWLQPGLGKRFNQIPSILGSIKADPETAGVLSGHCFDAHTGAPLADVKVSLDIFDAEGQVNVESSISNAEGIFRFTRQYDESENFKVRAQRKSFLSQEAQVTGASITIHLEFIRRAAIVRIVRQARFLKLLKWPENKKTLAQIERSAKSTEQLAFAETVRKASELAYSPSEPNEQELNALIRKDSPPTR